MTKVLQHITIALLETYVLAFSRGQGNELCIPTLKEWTGSSAITDCAGITVSTLDKDAPFSCGCHLPVPYPYERTHEALRKGLVADLIEDREIQKLQDDLLSGTVRSHRLFLHNNPTFNLKMKAMNERRFCVFDEKQEEHQPFYAIPWSM